MTALYNASTFLIHIIFTLFIFLVTLRVVLQWAGVHYFNPLTQFTVKLTNWIVKPLQRFLPSIYHIDLAGVFVIFVLEVFQVTFLLLLQISTSPLFVLLDPLHMLINIFFFAILIRAIFSWFAPQIYNPILEAIYLITEPLLRPIRKWIPPIASIDISSLIALIVLKLIEIILS